jgi:inosine-uridine nucleoside N-ribohydrolase
VNQPIPIILDTDIGTDIDDTWALAMLLGCPDLDPKLIVTVEGDTTYRANLTAKFLQIADRTEIPIGIGLGHPNAGNELQKPWLSDFNPAAYPGEIHENGIEVMIDTIMKSSKPVSIISIGIARNIARALEIEPRIAEKCRFIGMHGSIFYQYGGQPGAVAEANVRGDVPALRKVFAAPWREIIITPLDTCGLVELTGEYYQAIYKSHNPILKALIENYQIWAELVPWMTVDYQDRKSSTLFDTVAVYLAYCQDWIEIDKINLRITDDGLTVPDPTGDEVRAALRWKNLGAFYEHLVERLKP